MPPIEIFVQFIVIDFYGIFWNPFQSIRKSFWNGKDPCQNQTAKDCRSCTSDQRNGKEISLNEDHLCFFLNVKKKKKWWFQISNFTFLSSLSVSSSSLSSSSSSSSSGCQISTPNNYEILQQHVYNVHYYIYSVEIFPNVFHGNRFFFFFFLDYRFPFFSKLSNTHT